jgi:FtsZ-binding cell division protein ZapB
MSLGLQDNRRRRRHQRRMAMIKWLMVLILLGGAGAFAYATGAKLARLEVETLEEKVASLNDRVDQLQAEKAALERKLNATRKDLETWKQRYREEVPSGPPAELLAQVKQRLDNGVDAERLSFVISQAKQDVECTGGPVTRRFLVQTPLSRGAADSVSFADNTVTVTASGPSAEDAQGRPEAWFDPNAEIAIDVNRPGGQTETVEGTLPLYPSVVLNGQEHRFTVVEGDRQGFVEVTWQRCDYP